MVLSVLNKDVRKKEEGEGAGTALNNRRASSIRVSLNYIM